MLVFFLAPAGLGKKLRNSQNIRTYYMLNHRIRCIYSEIPSETIPDSRPRWEKCQPVFRPKRCKNPTCRDGTYLYGLYTGVPLPPRAWGEPNTCSLCFSSCKRQIPIRNTHARLDISEGLSLEFRLYVSYVTNPFSRF